MSKKGHIDGDVRSGRHTTLIDCADTVIKKMIKFPWLESVRPDVISRAKGGRLSVTLRRHSDETHRNTLKLIFRQSGSTQDVFVHAKDLDRNLPQIVGDISTVVEKECRGAEFYDRTLEAMRQETNNQIHATTNGAALLEKWNKKSSS